MGDGRGREGRTFECRRQPFADLLGRQVIRTCCMLFRHTPQTTVAVTGCLSRPEGLRRIPTPSSTEGLKTCPWLLAHHPTHTQHNKTRFVTPGSCKYEAYILYAHFRAYREGSNVVDQAPRGLLNHHKRQGELPFSVDSVHALRSIGSAGSRFLASSLW